MLLNRRFAIVSKKFMKATKPRGLALGAKTFLQPSQTNSIQVLSHESSDNGGDPIDATSTANCWPNAVDLSSSTTSSSEDPRLELSNILGKQIMLLRNENKGLRLELERMAGKKRIEKEYQPQAGDDHRRTNASTTLKYPPSSYPLALTVVPRPSRAAWPAYYEVSWPRRNRAQKYIAIGIDFGTMYVTFSTITSSFHVSGG